jgi:excisionase family DNA binding protein
MDHRLENGAPAHECFERIAVSVAEAASLVGLSRSFLYEEMATQRLRSIKKRGRRLITIADLRAYVNTADDEGVSRTPNLQTQRKITNV